MNITCALCGESHDEPSVTRKHWYTYDRNKYGFRRYNPKKGIVIECPNGTITLGPVEKSNPSPHR